MAILEGWEILPLIGVPSRSPFYCCSGPVWNVDVIDFRAARGMVESSGRPIDQARRDPELLSLLRAHVGIEHRTPRDELGRLIGDRRFADVERMVREQPELIDNEMMGWGGGQLRASFQPRQLQPALVAGTGE